MIGHVILALVGIVLCGYATAQQLVEMHNTQTDVLIFAAGILLVASSTIRRIVWTFSCLAALWSAAVWFGANWFAENDHSFQITQTLIAIAAVPPLLVTFYLEMTRKSVPNAMELEITLSKPTEPDQSA